MTHATKYRFYRIDDRELVLLTREFNILLQLIKPRCTIDLVPGLSKALDNIENNTELDGRFAFYAAHSVCERKHASNQTCSLSIRYQRSISIQNERQASAFYDEIEVSYHPSAGAWEDQSDKILKLNQRIG